MQDNRILDPITFFHDQSGQPLEAGFVYIGEDNRDAEAFPITVYWDDDLTIPASQPLRTIAGRIDNGGAPSAVYVSGAYSIKVKDKDGVTVYSILSARDMSVIEFSDFDALDAFSGSLEVGTLVIDQETGDKYSVVASGGDVITSGGLNLVYRYRNYVELSDMLGSHEPKRGAGSIWRAGGYRFREATSDATDQDLETAVGVKLYILPQNDGTTRLNQYPNTLSDSAIADLITGGDIDFLDFDYTSDSETRSFAAPDSTKSLGFSVNGATFDVGGNGLPASVPDEFGVAPIVSAVKIAPGRVHTDFDVSVYRTDLRYSSVKHYYVDPVNGTSGGAGTEDDPMDRPSRVSAFELNTPSAEASFLMHVKPGKYDQSATPMAFPGGLVKPYGIVPWGDDAGRIEFLQGYYADTRTWTNETGGVWSASISFVVSVFDEGSANDLGDPEFFDKLADEGSLTLGSWAQSGSTLYVKTLDGLEPGASIGIGRLIQNNITDGTSDVEIYYERVSFFGGATGTRMRADGASRVINFYTKDCKWRYAGGNGMEVYGHELTIHQDGEASYNILDGFNYHSDSLTLSKEGLSVEINCQGYRNGQEWSDTQDINNGSTAHDKCVIMRYGVLVFENQGPNIVDVNDVQSYNFACHAFDSRRTSDGPDKSDFDFSAFGATGNGTVAWLDCCDAKAGDSIYAVTAGCPVKLRNCSFFPAVYGVGHITTF